MFRLNCRRLARSSFFFVAPAVPQIPRGTEGPNADPRDQGCEGGRAWGSWLWGIQSLGIMAVKDTEPGNHDCEGSRAGDQDCAGCTAWGSGMWGIQGLGIRTLWEAAPGGCCRGSQGKRREQGVETSRGEDVASRFLYSSTFSGSR